MKFDGTILDVDGTLWDVTSITAASWNRALREVGAEEYAHLTSQILQSKFGKTLSQIAKEIFPGMKNETYEKFLVIREIHENRDILETKINVAFEGVRDTLKKLKILSSVKFYVVSNCGKGYIETMMKKLDIENFITDFESFGNTGKGKAENISAVIQRNGIKSPLYVGDTQGDADECKKAGVPFVWASYGYGKSVDAYLAKIDSFPELEKIIC